MSSIPGIVMGVYPVSTMPEGASQATAGLQPVIEELPDVDRTYILWAEPFDPVNLNLLTWNEKPSTASSGWLTTNVSITEGVADPDGGTGAFTITRDSASSSRSLSYQGIASAGYPGFVTGDGVTRYAARVKVKASTSTVVFIGIYNKTDAAWDQPPQTSRIISGPGIAAGGTMLQTLRGLSETVWTEVEIAQTAASESGKEYVLYFYPNGSNSMPSGTATAGGVGVTTTLTDSPSPAVDFDYVVPAGTLNPGVRAGMIVKNITDGSQGTVVTVDSATQITHTALSGGTNNYWTIGDSYEVVGASLDIYRPQAQMRVQQDGDKWTTPLRKTEEKNGPEGAPGETQYVRVSNLGYRSGQDGLGNSIGVTSPAHHLYPVALEEPYNASIQMFSGDRLEGEGVIGFGDVEALNPEGMFDEWERWTWSNRPLYIFSGSIRDPFEDFSPIFVGTAESLVVPEPHKYSIQIRDKRQRFNKPLQERVYGGFGSCVRNNATSSDVIDVGNHPAAFVIQRGNGFTVEARVRMFATPTQNGRVASFVGDNYTTSASDHAQFSIYWDTAQDRFEVWHYYGSQTAYAGMHQPPVDSGTAWIDGLWHHLALVYEVISSTEWRARWYLDGEEPTYSGGSSWDPATYGPDGGEDGALRIAALLSSGSQEFEGDIDDVRVWDHQRTEEEIASNKDRELRGDEDGLVAYYKLNEQTGTTTYCEVTTQYDTAFRRAYRFDGVDDYVRVPDANELSPTGSPRDWSFEVGCVLGKDLGATGYMLLKSDEYRAYIVSTGAVRGSIAWGAGSWYNRDAVSAGAWKPGMRGWATWTWDDTTKTLKAYWNGVLVDQSTNANAMNTNQTTNLFLGGNATANNFNGWLYGARLWDRTLADWEVAAKYDQELVSANETALVANYLMNETSGQMIDETAAGNDSDTFLTPDRVSTDATFTGGAGDIEWVGSGEGGPDLAGKPVPVIIGRRKHCEHFTIDPWVNVLQAGEGPLEALETLYEGGSPLVPPGTTKDDVWGADFIIESGTATSAHAGGTQLTDSAATFQTKGVSVGALVRNTTDGSTGIVTSITSETVLVHTALEGGTENDWDSSDAYEILSDYEFSAKLGHVRLRSLPFYPITGDYKGENSGALGYDPTAGGILRRLATVRGDFADPADLDTLDLSIISANAPQELGEQWTGETNLGSAMSRVMRSIHGTWYVGRGGKLNAIQLVDPAEGAVSAQLTENSIRWNELEKPAFIDPPWRQDIGWGPYAELDRGDLAVASLAVDTIADAIQPLRFHTVTSDGIRSAYLGSVPWRVETLLYGEADAKAEGDVRKALFGVRRRLWRLPLVQGLFQYDLGVFVEFTFDRFDFHAGQKAFVVGYEEDTVTNRIDIWVWF